MQTEQKKSPALDRIVRAIREKSECASSARGRHIDAHVDGGGGWHTDAWQG